MKEYSLPLHQSDIHWEITQWLLSIKYVSYSKYIPIYIQMKTASRWTRDFHKHVKSQGFCRTISFHNKCFTPEQTHSVFSSHISCIRILKDIIRLHPAQFMTNHPDAFMANSPILRGPERAAVYRILAPVTSCFSSRWTFSPTISTSVCVIHFVMLLLNWLS